MDEQQIADVFDTMFTAVRARSEQQPAPGQPGGFGQLGVPAHAQPIQQPPAPTAQQVNEAYKQLLDPASEHYNPTAALKHFVETNYGSLLGNMNLRTVQSQYANFEREFPDFKDHINDVNTVLAGRNPAEITERDVLGAYLIARGWKGLQTERQARAQAQTTTQQPSTQDQKPPARSLDATELEVARVLYRGDPDPAARYLEDLARDEGDTGYQVKVPVGGDKKE